MKFDNITNGQRVELALLHLDIAGHSSLPGTDRALQAAKLMLRKQAEGIASIRGGKLFQWAGDGGAFMFLTGDGEGFDDVAFTAMQILGTLPAINQEIHARTDLKASLAVRICCDCGMAAYHADAGNITGDFINKFMKNERTIGIANTISLTERVWKQLSAAAQKLFDPFKHSEEVSAFIYNRGGKGLQAEVLSTLNNRTRDGDRAGQFVEITAFKGDTLLDLSREAYADILGKGDSSINEKFANVGGLNLMVSKNAELARRHDERRLDEESGRTDGQFELREMLHSRADVDPHQIVQLEHLWRRLSPSQRRQAERELREADTHCQIEGVLQRLIDEIRFSSRQDYGTVDPLAELDGGESLRFYNAAALGFVADIGQMTLLDHVVARQLEIVRVVGGVGHTAAPIRTFVMKNGEYVEIDQQDEVDGKSIPKGGE